MPIAITSYDNSQPLRVRAAPKTIGELKNRLQQLGSKIPRDQIRLFSKIDPDADELPDDAEVRPHLTNGLLLVKKKL